MVIAATKWILIMTLWTGTGPEQQKKTFNTFEECQHAGIVWMLAQRERDRPAAYCKEVAYENLYGQREFSRIPFAKHFHHLPNQ